MSLKKEFLDILDNIEWNVAWPGLIISGILGVGIVIYSVGSVPTVDAEGLTREERREATDSAIDNWWSQKSNSFKFFVKGAGAVFVISLLSVLTLPIIGEILE